jgi:mono/diheme cytochrome c family protein
VHFFEGSRIFKTLRRVVPMVGTSSSKGWTSSAVRRARILEVKSLLLSLAFLVFAGALAHPALAADSKPDAMAGAVLYRDKGCAHCHGAHGEGTPKAPALADIRKSKLWTPDKITQQILNGGQKMPPFADSLSDPEVAQIVSFLRTKNWPSPPPAAPTN